MSARTDPCQTINDDLDVVVLGRLHDFLQSLFSSKHLVCSAAINSRERGSIFLAILSASVILALKGVVISFKCAHKINRGDSLFGVCRNTSLNISKRTPLNEGVRILVNYGILEIKLYLMEGVVSHASSVDNKSSLGDTANFLLLVLLVVVIEDVRRRKHWVWLANDFQGLKLAIPANLD
jgi:hypothetical protein